MKKNPRDHGYGPSPKVTGKPIAKPLADPAVLASIAESGGCPVCHCEQIMEIEVPVESSFAGGASTGRYLGCPACPWASPMVVVGFRRG